MSVPAALAEADRWGIEQHGDEIAPFAAWLLAREPVNVLEIGVRRGGTVALWHHLATGIVIGVDLSDPFTITRQSELAEAYPRYRGVLGDSHSVDTLNAVRRVLGNDSVDLLFLDGDHSAEGVQMDWEMYRPLVRPGGVVALHDIQPHPATLGVHHFWKALEGDKREWNIGAEWGGIGAVIV